MTSKDDAIPAETRTPQSRHGSLVLYETTAGTLYAHPALSVRNTTDFACRTRRQIQVVPQPSAILDIHFCSLPGLQNVLAVASSTGTLAFFKLCDEGSTSPSLNHLNTTTVPEMDEGLLVTSVAWHPDEPRILAVTSSSGEVIVLIMDGRWNVASSQVVAKHTLEAWTVAFSAESLQGDDQSQGGQIEVYSGGDDSTLRYTSLELTETMEDINVRSVYPAVRLGGHGAGVTAILPTACRLSDGCDVVITGSYDDHIRVFAIQRLGLSYGARKARLLAEVNLGGGVWRLKLISVEQSELSDEWSALILVSCMHAGSKVVRVHGSPETGLHWDVNILSRFEDHRSMNYGSDFVPGTQNSDGGISCVSTSFYDKALCLWALRI